MITCQDLRNQIERRKGSRDQLIRLRDNITQKVKEAGLLGRKLEEARFIIQTVALQTQQELQFHISAITTSALEAVFPDPYEFKIEFVERNNKTEADVFFLKDGSQIDPMTGSGGGAVDVAAFSLRCSVWKLKPSRRTIILDEPFKYLSRDLQPKAAEMLRQISQKLGLQIIMVTHNENLLEAADKVFIVDQKRRVSTVQVKGESVTKPNLHLPKTRRRRK